MNAIVTGATKGIGWAIAEKFAKQGFNLLICSRSKADLEEAREKLLALNSAITVDIFQADLSKKEEVVSFGEFCLKKTEDIDVLINNAGRFLPGNILEEEEGILETMIETNLYSVYHLTRMIAPEMKSRQKGLIVNMASIASLLALPNGGSYSISKFALRGLSVVLREELKPFGVKVTTILPGATWSNSWAGVDLPEERIMQATDIATLVWSLFEMSPSAVVEEVVIRPQLGDL